MFFIFFHVLVRVLVYVLLHVLVYVLLHVLVLCAASCAGFMCCSMCWFYALFPDIGQLLILLEIFYMIDLLHYQLPRYRLP